MVGTSYYEIYLRSNTELQDPMLKRLLESNSILFTETMYNFLENSIPQFNSPLYSVKRVRNRRLPYSLQNSFVADGTTNEFVLTEYPEPSDVENCIIDVKVNGVSVGFNYDVDTHKIVLDTVPNVGEKVNCEVYFIGSFNVALNDDEKYILSQFVVACWAEYVTNDKLDIIRLLGDTDFTLTSNASTTQAKVAWNKATREVAIKRMHKYSWDRTMMGDDMD